MEKFTFILSDGRLKNISILDLPGFGSKSDFSMRQTKEPSNLRVLKEFQESGITQSPNPFDNLFDGWSDLGDLWEDYVNDPTYVSFPSINESDQIWNFTKYI